MDKCAQMKMHPLIRLCLALLIAVSWCTLDSTSYGQTQIKSQVNPFGQNQLRFQTPNVPQPRSQSQPLRSTDPGSLQSEPLNRPVPKTTNVRQVSYEASVPNTVFEDGKQLESQGLWGEALSFYQDALKEYPKNAELIRRRALSRIHFDLNRRYSDTSFLRTISETDGTKALNVYAEVLLKIQSYYVDQPNWNQLAGYGLTSLEVALYKPEFQKYNLANMDPQRVSAAIQETRELLKRYPASSRHEIYVIASVAAQTMKSKLGMPAQATVYEFICGAISALDPYSAFMSSNQYEETMSQIEGNFVGLGVELRTHAEYLEIVGVIETGSAGLGGLTKGDRIIAVDNMQVVEIGSERAADMLRGVEGSYVTLALDRGGVPQTARLERRRVDIPSVDKVSIIDQTNGVGYIQLTNFQKTTARDFDGALWKLYRDGMRSLIVDVRGNPGGLLSASVEVADRFVGSGVIVSTRGRNPLEDFVHRAQVNSTWKVPLVVLIDENSASASEIFAAAIRDHRRGTIVGQRSYGKGSVQGIFPLNVSGGGVRLTTAKFYSPTGEAISQVGVKADVVVQASAKPSPDGNLVANDNGLRIGIQAARKAAETRAQKQQQALRQSTLGRG